MLKLLFNGKAIGWVQSSWGVYSKDEVAVGTWIDGRTVYRRVFEVIAPAVGETNFLVEEWTDNIRVIRMDAIIDQEGVGYIPIPKPAPVGSDTYAFIFFRVGFGICMTVGNSIYEKRPVIVIVEYVKGEMA